MARLSKEQFIQMLLPSAMEVSQKTGIHPSIIIAQAAHETGWGKSAPGNNYFGIKSHGQGGGQTFTTHEVVNGKRIKINDSFRAYQSPEDSVRGYGEFMMNNRRYAPVRNAVGLEAQAQALGRSGYATDPNYGRAILNTANSLGLDSNMGARAFGGIVPQQQPQQAQAGQYPQAPQAYPAAPQTRQQMAYNSPMAGGTGGMAQPQAQEPTGIQKLGGNLTQVSSLLSALAGGGEQQQMQMAPMPQLAPMQFGGAQGPSILEALTALKPKFNQARG